MYLAGAMTANRELNIEITRHIQRAWACFQRYEMEIYDRLRMRLWFKVRFLNAEMIEKLLDG